MRKVNAASRWLATKAPMIDHATERLMADPAGVRRAAALLCAGQLVSFPTETVYGLGADATNDAAVARIFEAKGRPHFNPLIVHVATIEHAGQIAVWSDNADRLAEAFWPGPVTLVLPLREDAGMARLATAGLGTVGLRVPAHPVAHELLQAVGRPVAAPSANPSGRISPTRADHVMSGLGGRIAAVLDGGPCTVGLESTIVGLDPEPTLLRAGGVPAEQLEATLGHPLAAHEAPSISAPGQLASHYAPRQPIRLNATVRQDGEVLLGFGDIAGDLNLSTQGDLIEAAAKLFDALHQLDRMGKPIAVAPVPAHGLGLAINDRLERAAAPRPDICTKDA